MDGGGGVKTRRCLGSPHPAWGCSPQLHENNGPELGGSAQSRESCCFSSQGGVCHGTGVGGGGRDKGEEAVPEGPLAASEIPAPQGPV